MQIRILIILFFFPLHILAQNNTALPKKLSGVWAGEMVNDTTGLKNDFELAISENDGKLSGFTYTVFLIEGKRNIGIKRVKVKKKDNLLLLEDDKLLSDNYDAPPARGVRTFMELHYAQNDTTEILKGNWKTNSTRQYISLTGTLFLERKKEPEATAIIPKLQQLNLSDQLNFLPKLTLASQNNHHITAKKIQDSKKIFNAPNILPEIDVATGLITKKNEQSASEKIIPDTTITNPEITIFMYPKNDHPVKKNREFNDTISGAAAVKDRFDLEQNSSISGGTKENIAESITPFLPFGKRTAERLSGRKIETIRTIEFNNDTLIFSLFDNGVIDGDTVSVLLNGEVIMSGIGLLTKAYNDTIFLSPEMGDSINIILFAENLGSIAPNTGLLVIRDGSIDHEIRFSGDLKNNSAIILKRKRYLNE